MPERFRRILQKPRKKLTPIRPITLGSPLKKSAENHPAAKTEPKKFDGNLFPLHSDIKQDNFDIQKLRQNVLIDHEGRADDSDSDTELDFYGASQLSEHSVNDNVIRITPIFVETPPPDVDITEDLFEGDLFTGILYNC